MTHNPSNSGPKVEKIIIDEKNAGQRIDNFLLGFLKGVPKSRIYRILRKGEVRVNKGRSKPDYRLQIGDHVRIPPIQRPVKEEYALNRPDIRVVSSLKDCIIFENPQLLVLNKPAGLAVHGGSGLKYGAIEAMRELMPHCRQLELVHRLDRETSGCLIFAKKRSVLRFLHEKFRNNEIKKRYVTLLSGNWPQRKQVVEAPLLKNTLRSGERVVEVTSEGKSATSIFTAIRHFEKTTFVEVELVTGRTHQIRVHAAHSGHPIAGDEKYGDRDFNQYMKNQGLSRLFLHAKSLAIPLPSSDENESPEVINVVAPLGSELEQVLEKLTTGDA